MIQTAFLLHFAEKHAGSIFEILNNLKLEFILDLLFDFWCF